MSEACNCLCHTNPGMTHVMACCHPCENCGENIRSAATYLHKKDCLFPIVGLTVEDARSLVSKIRYDNKGFYEMRIVKVNDNHCIVTHDYRVDRLNVEVVDGLISYVSNFG